MADFDLEARLGEGSYSEVFQVRRTQGFRDITLNKTHCCPLGAAIYPSSEMCLVHNAAIFYRAELVSVYLKLDTDEN